MDAPAKVNLVLQVGDRGEHGLHEICSLFASLELCDVIDVEPTDGGAADIVICEGVDGENLAAAALRDFRAATSGVVLPPLRVTIEKRIPVAAGLGGGSADAACVLRAANALAGDALTLGELRELALRLGSDVPSQVDPRHAIVTGSGEHVEPVSLPAMEIVLVPAPAGLSTADVYREADRIGTTRQRLEPAALCRLAREPVAVLAARLENDLEAAALSLRPELGKTIESLLAAGALGARVTGSGPTAFGIFPNRAAAERAAARLPGAIATAARAAAGDEGHAR